MSFLGLTTLKEQQRPARQLNGKTTLRRVQRNPDFDDEEDEEIQYGSNRRHRPLLNEWTITLILFLFSLSIVIGKLFLNHDFFSFLDIDNKVNGSNYKDITDKAIIQPFNKYGWFIKAVFSGLTCTGIIWFILYEDSNIPGVNPPSPFSPSKKRVYQQSSTLELNYFVGGLIGFLIFISMCL